MDRFEQLAAERGVGSCSTELTIYTLNDFHIDFFCICLCEMIILKSNTYSHIIR